MRKLFILCVIISFYAKGQNYIITPQNLNPVGNPGDLLFAPVLVTNLTNNSINFEYNRIYLNIPAGWQSCVCLPVCMVPGPRMHYNFTIAANSTETVMPNFQTDTVPGVGYSKFVFFESGTNVVDTLSFSGTTVSATGIKESDFNNAFIIYPNPTFNKVAIKISEDVVKSIKVYNPLGIAIEKMNSKSFQKEFEIELSEYSSGNYYIEIETKNNTIYRKKIVKL